jgi:hypothetical protein
MVDLSYGLVCLVHGIDKGKAHMVRFALELGQDGVTKGFGGNAGAIGDKEYGALGHGDG